VNRAVPDAEFAGFVNPSQSEYAVSTCMRLADIKRFVNAASLPQTPR